MLPSNHRPGALLVALMVASVLIMSARAVPAMPGPAAPAATSSPSSGKGGSSSTSSSSSSGSSSNATAGNAPLTHLFNLPIEIDEDDLLEEYGRFMMGSMNHSMDPCEDFYQYACGNWKHTALVPPKMRNDTFLHSIQVKVDEMMDKFLSNATSDDLKGATAEGKAKVFFRSCVQMSKDMDRGYKAVQEMEEFNGKIANSSSAGLVGAIGGSGAASRPANQTTFDWINVNFLSRYGMYALLPLKAHYSTDSRKFEVLLSPPKEVLLKPEVVDIANMTRDFKITTESARTQFVTEFERMKNLERNLTYHARTLNKTEKSTLREFLNTHRQDSLNWTRYFEVAFNGTARDEWVVHYTIGGLDGIVRYLQKERLDLLRTYIKWRTLVKFYYIWKADAGEQNVTANCREHTENYFNYALMPWFINTIYDAERRADVLVLARNLKEQFYDLIDRHTWLDAETKAQARTKLTAMDVEAGYHDDLRHPGNINLIYSDINMTATDWYRNLQVLEANRARVRMRSINKSLIPPLMSTLNVNAYYADFLNLAFIAIGISQLPFYHIKFPASLKFGGIGNIIGHEMAHGFDSYCYQFNYDGRKQNWWTEGALRNFRERYSCLESQYNKYIYRGVPTNGTLTSGDNIADNVGMRLAYQAYMRGAGKVDANQTPIRGLKFTNKQLYFLKFAQTWCTGKDDSYKMRKIRTDTHAYEEFRVTGTLSNMPEFSEAFQCRLGSHMNPMKKCVVW